MVLLPVQFQKDPVATKVKKIFRLNVMGFQCRTWKFYTLHLSMAFHFNNNRDTVANSYR